MDESIEGLDSNVFKILHGDPRVKSQNMNVEAWEQLFSEICSRHKEDFVFMGRKRLAEHIDARCEGGPSLENVPIKIEYEKGLGANIKVLAGSEIFVGNRDLCLESDFGLESDGYDQKDAAVIIVIDILLVLIRRSFTITPKVTFVQWEFARDAEGSIIERRVKQFYPSQQLLQVLYLHKNGGKCLLQAIQSSIDNDVSVAYDKINSNKKLKQSLGTYSSRIAL